MSEAEKPELSVIIPTYNRKEILLKTLAAYQAQSARSEILEVLVLDDGSTDGTSEAVSEFSSRANIPVQCFLLTHRGPAALRNHGIRRSCGRLLLFGDDDIVPGPDLVAEHLAWHKKYPEPVVGVLGLVEWAPEVEPTPFTEWLAKDGVLFAYGHLRPGEEVGFRCFYSCNLSLKTCFLRENGLFDEDFKGPAFEDTELGYRLERRGLRLLYNPGAIGYHHKFMSFADVCRRTELVAAAWRVLETKEAGKYLAEVEALRRRALASRVKQLIWKPMIPFYGLLRPFLDTQIGLPWFVYRKIYHYFAALPADRKAKRL
jgi:glycosyltransferase involved in cell wall biosynthesis